MIFFMGVIAFLIEIYFESAHIMSVGALSRWFNVCSIIYKPINGLEWFGINDIIIYGWSYSRRYSYYLLGDIKEKVNIAG